MIPYVILCLVPVVLGLGYTYYNETYRTEDKFKRLVIFLMWAMLFLMIALRSRFVGSADSYKYCETFKTLSKVSWAKVSDYSVFTGMEVVFCYATWILAQVFSDPQWLFVATGLLFSLSVCRFIYKHCEDMILAYVMFVTLGLYTFMVQGMRQAIAMSIILFAIDFCARRKFIFFALTVLLASAFHKSAIIFFPVYFIYGLTIRKSTVLLFILGTGVIMACAPLLIQLGNEVFGREYSEVFESGGFIAVAIYALILLTTLLFGAQRYQDKDYAFYFFMTFIGAVFYVMRYTGVDVAERISYYFLFGQMYLLPATLNRVVKRERWVFKGLVYALCIGLFLYRLSGSNLIPFRFFWQE